MAIKPIAINKIKGMCVDMEKGLYELKPKAVDGGPYYTTCKNTDRNCCYQNAGCLKQYRVYVKTGRKVADGCCTML